MFCNKCGKEIAEGSYYCSFCGQKQNYKVQKSISKNTVIGTIAYIGYVCCLSIYLYGKACYTIQYQVNNANRFNPFEEVKYQYREEFDFTYFSLMLFVFGIVLPILIWFVYNRCKLKKNRTTLTFHSSNKNTIA